MPSRSPTWASAPTSTGVYLLRRHVFGQHQAEPPPATRGERRWFIVYAPLAFAYRLFVLFSIAWFVAQHYFFIGVLLAVWTLITVLLLPLGKGLKALLTQPQYTSRAGRVWGALAAARRGTGAAAVRGADAAPHAWPRAWSACPTTRCCAPAPTALCCGCWPAPGDLVAAGQPVLESHDPALQRAAAEQQARVALQQARLDAAWSRAGRGRPHAGRAAARASRRWPGWKTSWPLAAAARAWPAGC